MQGELGKFPFVGINELILWTIVSVNHKTGGKP